MRIPTDTAALHRSRRIHRLGELRAKTYVERTAVDVLTLLGHPEGCARKHRVGFGGAIGGKDSRAGLADRIEDIGEKVDDPNVHLRLFAGMMVAQENAEFLDHAIDRAVVIAIGAFEGLAR